jgi:hypothetical protein
LFAALLAAAIITGKPFDKAKGGAPAAAKLYFDVLDAVKMEQDKRDPSSFPQPGHKLPQALDRVAQRSA